MFKIAWSEVYAHPLDENHRFPMVKYDLLPEQLIYEGTITESNLFTPGKVSREDILAVHDAEYWKKLAEGELSRSEIRKTGFPYSPQLVDREITIMQGTVDAALFALEYGVSMNIAGGTHHAFTNRGEGFCLLNDIAIAARYLQRNHLCRQILVVDLDVHQGNGTAEIFKDDPTVFTFSMHGDKNYPMHKEESDLDVAMPDGTGDKMYLSELDRHLSNLIDEVNPDFIFFQSGVDVLASDKLGRLAMTIAGCKERDRIVLETCKKNNIPVAACMGGGYSERLSHIIEAHANTYRLAQELYF
ncbi:histone deacetylase [Roseivirga sp. BDSF3-8]|uniref:histone deacetylase family protein n=1 Tax=Roseivirga sp. BDSF3-8 TaxID=3241598 RepID=UPI003531D977